MAKLDSDDDDRPGKPHTRRFPWRLWLYAITMTAAAGAGGYYAWQFRKQASAASADANTCLVNLGKLQGQVGAVKKPGPPPDDATRKPPPPAPAPATPAATAPPPAPVAATAPPPAPTTSSERLGTTVDELKKLLAKMLETGQLKLTARHGNAVLTLPSEPVFATGAAELSKPGELTALELGIMLKRFPDRRFLVIDHTDEPPAKPAAAKDSGELSIARASAVVRALVHAGVEPRNLIAAGAGDADPLGPDRAANRRIEIVVLPSRAELPPLPASLGPDTAVPAEAPASDGKPAPARPEPGKPAAPSTPDPGKPAAPPGKPATAPGSASPFH